jgi:trehalose utilization protein
VGVDPKENVLDRKSEAQQFTELYESVIAGTLKDIREIRIRKETVLIAMKGSRLRLVSSSWYKGGHLRRTMPRRRRGRTVDYFTPLKGSYPRLFPAKVSTVWYPSLSFTQEGHP